MTSEDVNYFYFKSCLEICQLFKENSSDNKNFFINVNIEDKFKFTVKHCGKNLFDEKNKKKKKYPLQLAPPGF